MSGVPYLLFHVLLLFHFSEHRYIELFLNSTAGGSSGGYGSQMMGGMSKIFKQYLWGNRGVHIM